MVFEDEGMSCNSSMPPSNWNTFYTLSHTHYTESSTEYHCKNVTQVASHQSNDDDVEKSINRKKVLSKTYLFFRNVKLVSFQ